MKGWRTLFLLALLGACLGAEGGWFNWVGKRRVEMLVVTGNFAKSRLLAELCQHKTKQPVLLISPEDVGRDELFFMPTAPDAMAFEASKYVEFVDFLNPIRIVFLGDTQYVPNSYIEQVRGRFPTVVLNSRDWLDNANALGALIKDKSLAMRYSTYFEKLDAAAGGPAGGVEPLALPPTAEYPAALRP